MRLHQSWLTHEKFSISVWSSGMKFLNSKLLAGAREAPLQHLSTPRVSSGARHHCFRTAGTCPRPEIALGAVSYLERVRKRDLRVGREHPKQLLQVRALEQVVVVQEDHVGGLHKVLLKRAVTRLREAKHEAAVAQDHAVVAPLERAEQALSRARRVVVYNHPREETQTLPKDRRGHVREHHQIGVMRRCDQRHLRRLGKPPILQLKYWARSRGWQRLEREFAAGSQHV
eukprot:46015-Pleurochrysis_carterae.AAC.2